MRVRPTVATSVDGVTVHVERRALGKPVAAVCRLPDGTLWLIADHEAPDETMLNALRLAQLDGPPGRPPSPREGGG